MKKSFKTILISLILLISVFAIISSASAATVNVNNGGSDVTGDGSSVNPYATLNKSVSSAGIYDTIYI